MNPENVLPGLIGLDTTAIEAETDPQGARYAAHSIRLGGLAWAYRQALVTPKKAGAFVTLWRRSESGPIRPLLASDGLDGALIHLVDALGSGLFVLPFEALERHGIATVPGREGKRGFRIYAPWTPCPGNQARRTRDWQREYFLEAEKSGLLNQGRLKTLLGR
ncbi:MepB family protein [Paeniglutamicibacter cryotolerans]|uniref:MepB family protein n=1 Tax=Paeniglutamicibacter cryotolerans TaxID=670079 RepID=A0A839QH91_9MICC|nr:MepB family protein [Paeniglutamicibacter cryotolerans]MBB2995260.1 hypothetical protein [Paeniglutamicibacter cryotolerans]